MEAEWLHLTRVDLPALAAARGWPIRADHCFQRILLDHSYGGCWYDHVVGRPAYAHAGAAALVRAIAIGRAAIRGEADMAMLNRQSLIWRGKLTNQAGQGPTLPLLPEQPRQH
ncbi:GCN5-related N-acetyltransferase [Sphingomonas sp. CFBP 8760]|nr:GCN5-related N-acetyltransferase [Sphingomonas sp. CFBP 8760]